MQTLDNTFIWSNLHMSHKNILQYSNRPFPTVDAMNEALLESVRCLPNDCYLYDLGDFSFGDINIVKRNWKAYIDIIIDKNIELVPFAGNHCYNLQKFLDTLYYLSDYSYVLNNYLEIRVEGKNFVLCHYPLEIWNGKEKGWYMCYGHSHRNLITDTGSNRLHVGIDTIGYKPITLRDVINIIRERDKNVVQSNNSKNHHISNAESLCN